MRRNRFLIASIICFALALLCASGLSGATYYVNSNAAAGGNGTTQLLTGATCAWDTIADVNAATFAAGDFILFARGCTWREQLTVPSSGSAGLPITFGAYGTGVDPIILGSLDLSATDNWTAQVATTPTSSDGFEVGDADLTNGDGAYWGGGGRTGATLVGNDVSVVAAGTYSAKNVWSGTGQSAYAYHSIVQVSNNFYQFQFNVNSMTGSAGNAAQIKTFSYNATDRMILKFIYVTASTFTVNLQIFRDGGNTTLVGTTVFNMGTWYTAEINYQNHAITGGGQYWINGISEGSDFTLDTDFADSQPNRAYIGLTWSTGTTAGVIYFDEVKYHTAYIGITYPNDWAAAAILDIGNLVFNSETSVGIKKSSLAELSSQGDFYCGGGQLYLYSSENPGTHYSEIEVAQKQNGISIVGKSYITIQNLGIKYVGRHGIHVDGSATIVDHIIIEHCVLSYIGGSYLTGTTRYGNGIEFWGASTNITVRYNRISQVYDAGLSPQGTDANQTYSGHAYYDNIVSYSESGFEIFVRGAGSTADGITVYNHIFFNLGEGWGHAQRPNPLGIGFRIADSLNATFSNSSFKNNIIYAPTEQQVYVDDSANDLAGWTIDYNDYYPDGASTFMLTATPTTFAGWKTATSQDAHSIVTDPQFVSTTAGSENFSLLSISPCINAGTDVGLTEDYAGNRVPKGNRPDIGAYEYPIRSKAILFIIGGI